MNNEPAVLLNYRDYLKLKIHDFYNKEGSYEDSLIKFTDELGFPVTDFISIMSGNKNIDKEFAFQIAFALQLDTKEVKYLITLINYNDVKNSEEKQYYLKELKTLENELKQTTIYGEDFKEISDWFHFAILELSRIENFNLTPESISKILDIPLPESENAMNRLIDSKLLVKENGVYKKSNTMILTSTDMPSFYIRKHHHQMIQKARFALEEQNVHERDITSLTIAINDADLVEIKKMYLEFKKKLSTYLAKRGKNKNNVFQFNFQVFSLLNNILKGDNQ